MKTWGWDLGVEKERECDGESLLGRKVDIGGCEFCEFWAVLKEC